MDLSCPNCGYPVPETVKTIVMQTCSSCDTTLYMQSDRLLTAGDAGEMHDSPALFGIGDIVKLGRKAWEVLGHARFSYGRGWWDEFWCEDPKGNGAWISVDEGDIIIQTPLAEDKGAPKRPGFAVESPVGHRFSYDHEDFRLVEQGEGTCVALRGAFGERLSVGDVFAYANAQGDDGTLLSCETDSSGSGYFAGEWHDPFEVDPLKARNGA